MTNREHVHAGIGPLTVLCQTENAEKFLFRNDFVNPDQFTVTQSVLRHHWLINTRHSVVIQINKSKIS